MKIQKYFGFISYNGKFFHGSQFQTSHHHTVQGCLKKCIEDLFPKNITEFSLRMASRTDAGVHAYKNSFDFFLKFDNDQPAYPASVIKNAMNSQFIKHINRKNFNEMNSNTQQLYLTDIFLCEKEFDSRKDPISRKYIYKIRYSPSLINDQAFLFTNDFYYNIFPHKFRSAGKNLNTHGNFSIEKIKEIIPVFQGQTYDYSNFYKNKNGAEIVNPVRRIDKIDCLVKEDTIFGEHKKVYEINLTFQARSFLRNQIRFLVNIILDYACDKISKEEICEYLLMKKVNLNKTAAPAQGLYLMDLEYDESKYAYHEKWNRYFEEKYLESKLSSERNGDKYK